MGKWGKKKQAEEPISFDKVVKLLKKDVRVAPTVTASMPQAGEIDGQRCQIVLLAIGWNKAAFEEAGKRVEDVEDIISDIPGGLFDSMLLIFPSKKA
jgi:hypothetical protein